MTRRVRSGGHRGLTAGRDGVDSFQPGLRLEAVERLDGVLRVELAGTELRVFTSRAQRVLAALCGPTPLLDQPIVSTKVTPISLENVFMELTGKEMRD